MVSGNYARILVGANTWSEHHLDFLRKCAPYHHSVPCERWLRTLVNRKRAISGDVDPGSHRSEEQNYAALGEARHTAIRAARSANHLGLYIRRDLSARRQGRRACPALLQHRGDGLASWRNRHSCCSGRARHPGSRSGWMAHLESAARAAQPNARSTACPRNRWS